MAQRQQARFLNPGRRLLVYDLIAMKAPLSRLCLALLLAFAAAQSARACQYCQLAAAGDPEAARMAAQIHGQAFPLDNVLKRYAPTTAPAILATPPPVASVVTKAADLPAAAQRRIALAPAASLPVPAKVPPVPSKVAPASPASAGPSGHWADAGLLGLLAAGGFFCWRTRRETAPRL